MNKLREVIKQYGRWTDLKVYIDRIELSVQEDFSLALENEKALIETICKEICRLKGKVCGSGESTNKLLKKAFEAIGYPASDSVTQISTALATIGQKVGDIRNETGATSHGKTLDELKERNNKIDDLSKEFLIESIEIISIFLIKNFECENPRIRTSHEKISYTDNPDFNDTWDDDYGEFQMGDYSYTASEILFNIDYQAYLTELKVFLDDRGDIDNE
jgi:hypothetical protein